LEELKGSCRTSRVAELVVTGRGIGYVLELFLDVFPAAEPDFAALVRVNFLVHEEHYSVLFTRPAPGNFLIEFNFDSAKS
jgi:hypothetical protein